MADPKDTNANKSGETKGGASEPRSGSDTASAAKISAGTSVGTAGQTPMPQAQNSTLASHTAKPLGGQAGATGAGQAGGQAQPQNNEFSRHVAQPSTQAAGSSQASGQSGLGSGSSGTATAKQAAQSATETVREAASQVSERAGELYEQASDWAREKYQQSTRTSGRGGRSSMRGMGQTRRSAERFINENPVMVGVLGLAAGLLIGALLPRTRKESEYLGEWADEVREQGMRYASQIREEGLRYAHDAVQRGREYVEQLGDDDPRLTSREGEQRPGGANRYQSH